MYFLWGTSSACLRAGPNSVQSRNLSTCTSLNCHHSIGVALQTDHIDPPHLACAGPTHTVPFPSRPLLLTQRSGQCELVLHEDHMR